MSARRRKQSPAPETTPWTRVWIARLICVSALVIPLVISYGGRNSFRLPKEIAFRGEILVLTALILIGLILRHLDVKRVPWRHPAIALPIAIAAWTGVTTLASTHRGLSGPVFLYALGACLVFAATFLVARERELRMLDWILWAGIVNSALYTLVALRILDNPLPLTAAYVGHNAATGLLGNSNDVGATLLPVAIAATAAALASKARRRFYAVTAILAVAAIMVSVSVAAIGAMFVALAALALVWNWKRSLVVMIVISLLLGGLMTIHVRLSYRVTHMIQSARAAQWDDLLSGRLTSFAAALEMFRDHPVTGVGPGTYGWQYYPYKLEVSERNPRLFLVSDASRFNFEETHNDHLEVLAETGFPGYALFLASFVLLAVGSLRRSRLTEDSDRDEERAMFARYAQLPLAVGIGVIALAQYPLQLTSALVTLLFIAALCMAWRDDLEPEQREEEAANA